MFDREVVETLLKYVPLYPKGTMVTLSDGREAIIYENFGVHNLRPVVRLMDGELLDLSNEANYHITLRMKTESGFSTEEAEKERNEMPEMDGIETAKRIMEMTDHTVPILFVTALCDRQTVTLCRNLDAAGYIVRPYKPVFVKTEIKRILMGRSEIE